MTKVQEAIAALKAGNTAHFNEYYNAQDMKSIMAEIKAEVPTAWVIRSPSTNRWTVHPN